MNLLDYIKRIARTDEIMAKIRAAVGLPDKTSLPSFVGIGSGPTQTACSTTYDLPANSSFDFQALVEGTAGPTLVDPCTRINTITGFTDFDTVSSGPNAGSTVVLILQMDGVFK